MAINLPRNFVSDGFLKCSPRSFAGDLLQRHLRDRISCQSKLKL
jgi:hypothetical protein